ncbi:LCP family protein [Candidatus Gracilibacteria bacterium]|nr:LCP family protein [Candidatus Gracilibacteria bacterium]
MLLSSVQVLSLRFTRPVAIVTMQAMPDNGYQHQRRVAVSPFCVLGFESGLLVLSEAALPMQCAEARSLLDQGCRPNSQSSAAAQLGFHLSHCPKCRAYRARASQGLLDQLLATPAPSAAPKPQPNLVRNRWRLPLLLRLLVVFSALVLLVFVARIGLIAIRVGNNLDALLVTPAPVAAAQRSSPPTVLSLSLVPTSITTPVPAVMFEPTMRQRYGGLQDDSPLTSTVLVAMPTVTDSPQPLVTSTPLIPQIGDDGAPLIAPLPTPVALPSIVAGRVLPVGQGGIAAASAGGDPKAATTILLLGTDRRPGESGIPRTDAVMLLRIERDTQRIALLSFPRDLWVSIPGFGFNRINSAFVWGEYYGWPGGGWALTRETVSSLIDAPIDYTVMVDFESFIRIIDAIGGVTIDVQQELYDASYPTMNYGYQLAYFAAGEQTMDGATALMYSRIRHPDSDFERVRRQQSIIVAIGQKLRDRGELRNLLDAEALSEALVGNVQTDMPRAQMIDLAWSLRAIDLAAIERYSVNPAMVSRGVDNDSYALVPDRVQLGRLVNNFLFGETRP